MAGGREWTTSEVRQLHELRERRVKTADIARILGRTKDAINGFLSYVPVGRDHPPRRCSVPRANRWTDEDIETLHRLAQDGASADKAAFILRRTPKAIRSRAQLEQLWLPSERRR